MHAYVSYFYKIYRKIVVCKTHSVSQNLINNNFTYILSWKNIENILVQLPYLTNE